MFVLELGNEFDAWHSIIKSDDGDEHTPLLSDTHL